MIPVTLEAELNLYGVPQKKIAPPVKPVVDREVRGWVPNYKGEEVPF
jgi:hypothetical protein